MIIDEIIVEGRYTVPGLMEAQQELTISLSRKCEPEV